MMGPLSAQYLSSKVESNKTPKIKRLEEIREDLQYPISSDHTNYLLNEKEKILSNPNFKRMKLDYDSKNKDAVNGALYILLGGAALSLGSLGSFIRYQNKISKTS